MIQHHKIHVKAPKRGYHLITNDIINQLPQLPESGILQLFIQHTSAALTLNENADPSVRVDFSSFMNHIVPERMPFVTHDYEGDDDMPAHIKSSLIGASIQIPFHQGKLLLGTWQGIYLCEFRDYPSTRSIIASIIT